MMYEKNHLDHRWRSPQRLKAIAAQQSKGLAALVNELLRQALATRSRAQEYKLELV